MKTYQAVVESGDRRDTFGWLKIGRVRIAARLWPGIKRRQRVSVRIRPEDVLICADPPGRVSARNVLAGHVAAIKPMGELATVTVNVGFALDALVTKRAVQELRLRRRAAVYAVIKATAIVPEIAIKAKVRVSIEGTHGLIGHERLDFLRALDATGSLSAAAKQIGITFKTAWLWMETVNHAWGKPLVASRRGGRGGGGARLTPEGRALVEWTSRLER